MNTASRLYEQAAKSNTDWRIMRSVRKHEGYRGMPYDDTLGKPTIGVGTLLPLTEDEAMLLAYCRMNDGRDALGRRLYEEHHVALNNLDPQVEGALVEMAFQLGVSGVLRFERMLDAIKREDWVRAAQEALNSRWAQQTPARAEHVAEVLRAQA